LHKTLDESHIEDLFQIPPEMIDGTEGQVVLCFSIKQGLELVTVDTADFPPRVFRKQMVSDSVCIILGC